MDGQAGADVNAKTKYGETAMDVARSSRAYDVMVVLMKYLKK